jgi:hypothetical protein
VQRALAVPDERLRHAREGGQAAAHPPEQVDRLLREDECTRAKARVAERRQDDVADPRLAVTDRDRPRRLPEIELADLPRPVAPALVGARRREEGPHLAQVVVDDRLSARPVQELARARPRQVRVGLEQAMDLGLEGIELRARRRSLVTRRLRRAQRPPHRVAITPRTASQLLDRDAGDKMVAPQLRPLLHLQHTLLLTRPTMNESGSPHPRTSPPTPVKGVHFQRRNRVSIHPAPIAPIRVHFKDGNWRIDGGTHAQGLYVTRRDVIKAGTYASSPNQRSRRLSQLQPVGVKWSWNLGWGCSQRLIAGVLWVASLSRISWTSSSSGSSASIRSRNCLNSSARWRRWSELIRLPLSVSSAANSELVP